jgi:energy-coupling factor transporter ATP-binding protein EcfA2
MDGQAPAIEVAGLCKSYGRLQAVNNVSFQVSRAEIHALLGQNGTAKPTIVEILKGHAGAPPARSGYSGPTQVRARAPLPGTDRDRTAVRWHRPGTHRTRGRPAIREFYARPPAAEAVIDQVGPEPQVPVQGTNAVAVPVALQRLDRRGLARTVRTRARSAG